MILPSRAGEDSMIERKMIRVQDHDQDQLDTKPPPYATANPVPNSVLLSITPPIQLTTKFRPSSHLPRDCAPSPSAQAMFYSPLDRRSSVPTRKRLAATRQAMLPHPAGKIGRLKSAEGCGPGRFSSTVLNDLTHVE